MKYNVILSPKETKYTISVEAASLQLAVLNADRRFGITHDIDSVNGIACAGKCDRCEQYVFDSDYNKFCTANNVMCGLCVSEVQFVSKQYGKCLTRTE